MTTRLMRWVMRDWGRVRFFNRYLAGRSAPRIQLDLVPGIACAAHFLIIARAVPKTIDDFVAAGRAMQRFWLTATQVGLRLQPEMTPLIFATYVRQGRPFLRCQGFGSGRRYSPVVRTTCGTDAAVAVFMGRIGEGPEPLARSLRLPLDSLMFT